MRAGGAPEPPSAHVKISGSELRRALRVAWRDHRVRPTTIFDTSQRSSRSAVTKERGFVAFQGAIVSPVDPIAVKVKSP
jgi:hypothetical protein